MHPTAECRFNAIPRVILAPLFIIWLGIGLPSKVALSFILVVVIIFFAVYNGVREADLALVERVRTLGSGIVTLVRDVYVPSVVSWIMGSLKVALGFAFTGAVVGEFVASTRGLGTLRLPPLPVQGEALAGDDGRRVRFSLRVHDGRLQELRFACTRCTTLVACCQALVELNRGCFLPAPRASRAPELLARLRRAGCRGAALGVAGGRTIHPPYGVSFMKVAYIFSSQGHTVSYVLGRMILPQLEEGRHGVDLVGMFFFEDNNYVLLQGNPLGERLRAVAEHSGMLLMGCDQCCYEREIADKLVAGARVGCFPDLYAALAGNTPDQVITL